MRISAGEYEIDDDLGRVDAEAAVAFLTTEAYWGRWRGATDIKGQIATAWRVVGAYDATGIVGFAKGASYTWGAEIAAFKGVTASSGGLLCLMGVGA